jgi:flavin reductase (DIM6/NTAB) family NADH-FMN oxidoreductase RutF
MDIEKLNENFIKNIGSEWMLITAGNKENLNTMTASWGFAGVMWGKPVAIAAIRPQRYTMEFVEKEDYYTLSFLGENKAPHGICGKKSGRDIDKIKEAGLTTLFDDETGAPFFDEARLVLICKKLYAQPLKADCFKDKEIINGVYPTGDFHNMIYGEIVSAYIKN